MLGLAWAVLALAGALLWHRHLTFLVVAIAAVWTALPGISRLPFALGPIDLHPGATLTLAVLVGQLRHHPTRLARPLRQAPGLLLVLAAVSLLATVETLLVSRGPEGVMFAVEQMLCSVILVVLVGALVVDDPAAARRLSGWLLLLVAVESVWALVQSQLHQAVLYQADFESQYWYGPTFDRWMGTLDHPLVLSLVIVLTFPLLARRMNFWLRLLAMVLLAGGMLATQSRTGFVLLGIEVLYLALRSRTGFLGRLGMILCVLAGISAAGVAGAFSAVAERITGDDGGSADARAQALDFLWRNLANYGWMGEGLGKSFELAAAAGLGTSLENSFIMFVVDMGLVLTLAYFACMVACVVVGMVHRSIPGAWLGAIAGLVTVQTFSGMGTRNAAAAWVWIVLAMALFSSDEPLGRRSLITTDEEEQEAIA